MEAAEAAASLFEGASTFGKLVPGGKFTHAKQAGRRHTTTLTSCAASTHHVSDDSWLNQDVHRAATPTASPCFPSQGHLASADWSRRARAWKASTPPSCSGHGRTARRSTPTISRRVKVRFYWDHRAEATDAQSVWARVIQPWAGKGWGAQFIPRVGTEVAVAFVDGDPDRPDRRRRPLQRPRHADLQQGRQDQVRLPHPLQPEGRHLRLQRVHLRRQEGQRTHLSARPRRT